jgi:hypothetical protein
VKRTYADTSNFRAPFDPVAFQGIGAVPVRRTYEDVSQFRAPYNQGYYQSGELQGLGAATSGSAFVPSPAQAPPNMRAYLQSGRPMGTLRRDLGSALNQVPQWVYVVLGATGLYFAYKAYKQNKAGAERTELGSAPTQRSAELAANYRRNGRAGLTARKRGARWTAYYRGSPVAWGHKTKSNALAAGANWVSYLGQGGEPTADELRKWKKHAVVAKR